MQLTPASGNLANAVQYQTYNSATFTASGGTGQYLFYITSGSLPQGMRLPSQQGGNNTQLQGSPQTSGSFTFNMTAIDSVGANATNTYTLFVASAPNIVISPTNIPAGQINVPYVSDFVVSGSNALPYTITVSAGSLPPGVTFTQTSNVTARISGTPTNTGDY